METVQRTAGRKRNMGGRQVPEGKKTEPDSRTQIRENLKFFSGRK